MCTFRILKHFAELYQDSLKARDKQVESNIVFVKANSIILIDVSNSFNDLDVKIDHLIGDGILVLN